MIDQIPWPRPARGEAESPFARGREERPLRLTFHMSSFQGLDAAEAEALSVLEDQVSVADIEALRVVVGEEAARALAEGIEEREAALDPAAVPVAPGSVAELVDPAVLGPMPLPLIDIPSVPIAADFTRGYLFLTGVPAAYEPVKTRAADSMSQRGVMNTVIFHPDQLKALAASLTGHVDESHAEVQAAFDDLLAARAHRACGQDIFVTGSRVLIENRSRSLISECLPRTPSEAARLGGLFMRSRDNYEYAASPSHTYALTRGLLYEVVARHRIPHLWPYHVACQATEGIRPDDTPRLGGSVYERAGRALQARDAIGARFYAPQNNDTRDAIMYHFDYLTLLLSGALDTQARVAYRAYCGRSTVSLEERLVSFRRKDFRRFLRSGGASDLHRLVASQSFKDIDAILSKLRNTIHGAILSPIAFEDRSPGGFAGSRSLQQSIVELPKGAADTLWPRAERLGGAERWGLMRLLADTYLEPYSFATTLIEEMFKIFDAVAAATDVTLLFQPPHAAPVLPAAPQDNYMFNEALARRLDALV